MVNTKITRSRLKTHMMYHGWMYVVMIAVSLLGWNIVYSVTEPKTPPELKLDIYYVANYLPTESSDAFAEAVKPQFPDLLEINVYPITLSDEDTTGYQVLQTRIFAQEGDVFFFRKADFASYARIGAFLPLDAYIADGTLNLGDIDLTTTTMREEDQSLETPGPDDEPVPEKPLYVYGINCESLEGLKQFNMNTKDLVMGVMVYGKNQDNALKLVQWIVDTYAQPAG